MYSTRKAVSPMSVCFCLRTSKENTFGQEHVPGGLVPHGGMTLPDEGVVIGQHVQQVVLRLRGADDDEWVASPGLGEDTPDIPLYPLLQNCRRRRAHGRLAATLCWYRQVSGGSVWEALIVRPSDRRFYSDLLQRLRTRALPAEKRAT